MKKLSLLIIWPLLLTALFIYPSPATAQSYWDPSPSLDAFPGNGGTGNWDNTTLDWWVSGNSDTTWTPNNIAFFEGSAGTVTVAAGVTADGLTFTTPSYTVSGSSTLTLAGATPTITVPTGNTTISAAIAGTNGLFVSGPGTLTLSGANTYTGGTTITNGATLSVNSIADTGTSALGPSTNLVFGGGTLAYTGPSVTTGRGVSVSAGITTASIDVPPGVSLTLTNAVKGTATSLLNKIDSGTLILAGTTDNSGFLMNINGGEVIITKSSASTAHGLGGGTNTVNSGAELQLAGSGGFDLYSGCVLVVNSGGLFDLGGQSDTITTLTLSGTGFNGGALINSGSAVSSLTASTGGVILGANTTIGGPGSVGAITLASKVTGGFFLTQAGPGTLTLAGASSTYSGLNINAGTTVDLTSATAGGSGTIAISGNGVLIVGVAGTYANAITGGSSSVIDAPLPAGNTFLTGSLSGFSGTINCGPATTTGQLVINNANNAANPISSAATWNIANGAVVDLATPYTVDTASVILNGPANSSANFGALRLDACNQEGNVLLMANSSIGNGNAGAGTISGVISDNNAGYGITMAGGSTESIILTAVNTYRGATIVSNGTLSIGGSGSIASSSGVAIANGATFDVSTVNGGTYFLGSGQTLSTLGGSATVNGNLDVSSGSPLSLQYNTANTPLTVNNGTLNLNNNPITVTLTGSAAFTGGQVALISGVSGSVASSVLTFNQTNSSATPAPILSISGGVLYLTINNPVITSYSPYTFSNLNIFLGGVSPTLSLTAVGNPVPTYQWYRVKPSGSYAVLSGQTAPSYTPPNSATGSFTNFCVVQNSAGSATNFWVLNVFATNSYAPYPLAVLQSTNSAGATVPPIAYWRLDEASNGLNNGDAGVPVNDWLGGNIGTYTNVNLGLAGYSATLDPTETSAQFGSFATTDSVAWNPISNPNLNMGAASGTAVNLSVECWINAPPQTTEADATIVSQGINSDNDTFVLACNANASATRYLRFYIGGSGHSVTAATSTILPNSTWQHLVGVCNESAGTLTLYVNGVSAATATIGAIGLYTSGSSLPIVIGGEQAGAGGFTASYQWKGQIDDVAIYNYALTAADVAAHYNAKGTAPTVTVQASTNVDYGAPLVISPLSVVGTPPLTYSWKDSNANTVISTSPTLTIASATTDKYILTVSNAFSPPVSTNTVVVTAYQGAPSFSSPGYNITPSSIAVYTGIPVTFSVLAYGTYPLAYQWYSGAGSIAGATNTSLTVNTPAGSNTYYCVVNNGIAPAATSSNATLVGISQPVSLYPQTILSNVPLAYWRLDEQPDNGNGNTGTIAHDYVGGHNASYNGVELAQPGDNASDSNTAALFGVYQNPNSYAGEINYSSLGIAPIDLVAQTAEFTVEAWVKASGSQTSGAGILAKGYTGDEQFILQSINDAFEFEFHEANNVAVVCQSVIADTDGNWHHLVGVCDEGGLASAAGAHFYVDGADQADSFVVSTGGVEDPGSSAVQDRVSIGARAASNTSTLADQFVGEIADVAIYNYALSAAQVLADYNAGTNLHQINQLSTFRITSATYKPGPPPSVTLTWQSVSNYTYQVQVASTLNPLTWSNLGPVITATGTFTSYTDTSTNATQGLGAFYQVIGYGYYPGY